jgi:hypothetical protein
VDDSRTSMITVASVDGLVVRAALAHGQQAPPPWFCGSLEAVPLADLIKILFNGRKTGRLDVQTTDGVRSLFFEGGAYCGCASTRTDDRLGEVMWRSGRISLDQLMIASEIVKTEGKLLGRALMELGFLDPGILRESLVDQAVQCFEAACLEQRGVISFIADVQHKSPVRLGVAGKKLLDTALEKARDHRLVLQKLGSLDQPLKCPPSAPKRTTPFDEGQSAIIQLIAAAKEPKTMRDAIASSSLGMIAGAKAVLSLIVAGDLTTGSQADDARKRTSRLCNAVNLVMTTLDEAGFGAGEQVREVVAHPPPQHEDALAGVALEQAIDEGDVLEQAKFIPRGPEEMNEALQFVLDEALRQAHDVLAPELTNLIVARVRSLLS